MTRTGIFITSEELEGVRIEQKCSGMWLPNGTPLGDPEYEVAQLMKRYEMPAGSALDSANGEFLTP